MEIEADILLKELREELNMVAEKMLGGVENWEEYVRLQARATVLLEMNETVKTAVSNRTQAEGV